MLKVLLADDEPIITRGLKKMIDWEKLNAQVVGEAENGMELLELIHNERPDIIISDINMPELSGIDVIKKIQENSWDIKVIFLSGYQEFEYAKQAISYGAVDYLLKPVGQAELEQAIQKAGQMIQEISPLEFWETEKNDMQAMFQKINAEYGDAELYEHFRKMGFETAGKAFSGVCFVISSDTMRDTPDQNMLELVQFSIFKRIGTYVEKMKYGFVIKREPSSSNVILLHDPQQYGVWIEQVIAEIRQMIQAEYNVRLVTGVGKSVDAISELKTAYKTARFAARLHYFCQQEMIYFDQIPQRKRSSFEVYNVAYKEFVQGILHKEGGWQEALKKLMSIIEQLHYGDRNAAENRCIAMTMDLYKELQEYGAVTDKSMKSYERFVAQMREQISYPELTQFILRYLGQLINKEMLVAIGSESDVILRVKQFIREHCEQELSLNSIAKMEYMSPYYFSTFFKRETGQNFKSYVIEVRMKKAMQLLRESNMKTYELAKMVGYNDVRNFSEKFKEYFGDTPSAYRKLKSGAS